MKKILLFAFYISLLFVGLSIAGIIGPSRNNTTYLSTAINGSYVLNNTTFTLIVPENKNRHCFIICNLHDKKNAYINFRSVIDSVDETGLFLQAGTCKTMLHMMYTGPITAIADEDNPKVSFLSY